MKNNNCWSRIQLSALAIVGLFYSLQALAAGYTITDLGTLGGTFSYAYGINNSGQVVGTAAVPGDAIRSFLWQNGSMQSLGTLGGDNSIAYDINNHGQVVGVSSISGGGTLGHAFLWQNGSMQNLGVLGGDYSGASAINDSGTIVGWSNVGNYPGAHAFVYANNVMTDLGTLGGTESSAAAINSLGYIVGNAYTQGNTESHMVAWDTFGIHDLHNPNQSVNDRATSINASNQIVGVDGGSPSTASIRAFLLQNGVKTYLGTFGGSESIAGAINESGQIVGEAFTTAGNPHAFLYEGNTLQDLNSFLPSNSGWVLQEAHDINDRGQIVGHGTIGGVTHAFLMAPVPIPAALWLFGSGMIGLFGFMRKR